MVSPLKHEPMKIKNVFPIAAMLLVVFLGSCNKDKIQDPNLSSGMSSDFKSSHSKNGGGWQW
jgi:hypothetical protein